MRIRIIAVGERMPLLHGQHHAKVRHRHVVPIHGIVVYSARRALLRVALDDVDTLDERNAATRHDCLHDAALALLLAAPKHDHVALDDRLHY